VARVECKYNWTPVAHFLLEAFAAHDFKAGELRILLLLLRETYGRTYFVGKEEHRRETCKLKQADIAERTGIPEPSIRRIIASLVKDRVLRRPQPAAKGQPATLGLNTKVKQWNRACEGEVREKAMPSIDGCTEKTNDNAKVACEAKNKDHHGSPIPGIGITTDPQIRSAVIPIPIRCDPYFESQPCNHAVLSPSKEPFLNNQEEERDFSSWDLDEENCPEKSEADMMVSDIIINIHKVWYAMGGIPHTLRGIIRRYVESYADDLDGAWQAFDEVYTAAVLKHKEGKKIYPPAILDDAAAKMNSSTIKKSS
jgi:hypothetical protein